MTNLLRFFVIAAVAGLMLSGCGKTDKADDGHDHDAAAESRGDAGDSKTAVDSHDDHDDDGHDHASEGDSHDDDDHADEGDSHDDHGDEEDGIIRLDDHELSELMFTLQPPRLV